MQLRLDIGYKRNVPLLIDLPISFDLGTTINIVGDNGCGKTTLYKTFAGVIPPLKGSVPHLITGSCSLISDRIQPPHEASVDDLLKLIGPQCFERLCDCSPMLADSVSLLLHSKVSALSTGQRRLLEISLVLAAGKQILLLDEAFSGLDYRSRETCLDAVKKLQGITVFNTSHNLEDVIDLGGEIFFLDAASSQLIRYDGSRTVEELRQFMMSIIKSNEREIAHESTFSL